MIRVLLFLLLVCSGNAAFFDSYNREAQQWRVNVLTNGATLSSTSYVSATVFMQHLRQWGLRPKVAECLLYLGSSTGAVFTAIIHDLPNMNFTVQNVNFVGADYSESVGMTGNGSTKAFFLASTGAGGGTVTMSQLTQAAHLGVYCRSNVSSALQHMIGGTSAGSDSSAYVLANFLGNTYGQVNDTVALQWSGTDTNAVGLYIATRTATNFAAVYKNGVQQSSQTGNLSGNHNSVATIALHAINADGTLANYTTRTLSFATVGYGLTATDNLNYYRAVQRVQLNAGRAVP